MPVAPSSVVIVDADAESFRFLLPLTLAVGLMTTGVEHHQVLSSDATVGIVVRDSSRVIRFAHSCGGTCLVAYS